MGSDPFFAFVLERVMGIEPTLVAWEATVLPLNYTRDGRHFARSGTGEEALVPACGAHTLPSSVTTVFLVLPRRLMNPATKISTLPTIVVASNASFQNSHPSAAAKTTDV